MLAEDSLPCVVGSSAMLESDLHKVQQKVSDLQRQRQELSMQVRQLTDRSSQNLQQVKSQTFPKSTQGKCGLCVTFLYLKFLFAALGNKKKMHSLWRETDLDTMNIVDHGDSWDEPASTPASPLYINAEAKQGENDFYNRGIKSDSTSEDIVQNTNFLPQEKQEIKTVRIVKRESERRQRDRDREKIAVGKYDSVLEEDDTSKPNPIYRANIPKTQSTTNLELLPSTLDEIENALSGPDSLSSPNVPQEFPNRQNSRSENTLETNHELSPVFKSEAARQIITEMSIQETPKQPNKRVIPKEKRRHYTAPHNNLIMKSLNQLPTDDNSFEKLGLDSRRARDDLDMERALRQKIDAPDVVRSTLSNKELKYNENTIDNILGTPNKISIPERYIPEQLPQLSAEEQEHRQRKVESIKKMLSDTTIISGSAANTNPGKQ